MKKDILATVFVALFISGCAGLKVIKPQEPNQNAGTLAVDFVDGVVKLVPTYTCKMESMGRQFSAVGKTEEDARKEVVARCRDHTVISFCKPENVQCLKN